MAKEKAKRKLSRVEQAHVCQWLAMFYNPQQVVDLVEEKFKKTVTYQNIYASYLHNKKWKPVIEKLREEFLSEINSIPIANKAVRLQRLEKIYQESMIWRTTSISEWGSIEKLALRAAISANTEARREIEGEKGGDTNITINISDRMTAARQRVLNAIGKN